VVCNQDMYCPGICCTSAIVKAVAIIVFSYHSDNVAIFMFRSHVLYLDNTKGQTTFNLRQLRPLTSKLGRAAIRSLSRQNPPWQGGEPQSYLRRGSKLFFLFHQHASSAHSSHDSRQHACKYLAGSCRVSRFWLTLIYHDHNLIARTTRYVFSFFLTSNTHFYDETHTTFAVFTLAVA
jgi:hypothetical protein